MIIGINGWATAGKDTVAKLLQVIFYNRLVGQADQHEGLIPFILEDSEVICSLNNASGWPIKRMADPLKRHVAEILGVSVEKLEDHTFKKSALGPEWDYNTPIETSKCPKHKMYVRDIMIGVGNGLRDNLHPDYWLNGFRVTYVEGSNVIVPDMRYPNEADYINENGMTIRVRRKGVKQIDSYSEKALDNYGNFHYYIDNDGTIKDLFKNVIQILHDYEQSDTNVD